MIDALTLLSASILSESDQINLICNNWEDDKAREDLINQASLILNDEYFPIRFSIDCAERVIDLINNKKHKELALNCINSAKNFLINPSEENREICRNTSTAFNSAAGAIASFAYSADNAADYAAYSAAYASAYAAKASRNKKQEYQWQKKRFIQYLMGEI